ncbi:hypothetical protein J1N35_014243 [Gossypium stocksii]|uniref:Uncharacterized protein n=1 Tax=Gossypium stocksii TaxID=47602 RepID=A0A9D3VTY3_9ROSI|nr:hypothetical protein J1N35_014243 [Gossypium stocksii]
MGVVPAAIFTSLSRLPLYISTPNKFEWMPYSDPTIQECILLEFLVNPHIWHVKVSLVVYITLEMHESDRVLRQFKFRKSIPSIP